jgi:osmotically-inducible protein OsmY
VLATKALVHRKEDRQTGGSRQRTVDFKEGRPMSTPRALEVFRAVRGAILRDAVDDANNITVDVDGTAVTLHGHVNSEAEKRQAERAAWSSPHVTKVDNQITTPTT